MIDYTKQLMTVSFCVIAYNEEKALRSLFNDICLQNYPHDKIEVVFVDSASTDKTKQLMEEFKEKNDDFIRVVIKDNPKKKQAAGWNIAVLEAKCDIIIRIDAHTSIPSNFVRKSVECIESGEDVCGGPRPNISEENTPWQKTLLLAEKSMFGSSIARFRRSHHQTYVKTVFHGAYRREVFDKAGLFNEDLGRTEDNEMHYRIRKVGYKICYTPEIISYQHIRNSWEKMIRQKYENGYWIGITVGICPQCLSFYHFVPLLFVLGLIFAGVFAAVNTYIPFRLLILLYLLVNVIMSIVSVRGEEKHFQYLLLPFIFFSLHLCYGIGTIVGLLKAPFWRKGYKGNKYRE